MTDEITEVNIHVHIVV